MDIVVCIKRVPDTTAQIKIAKSGTYIDPEGIEYILNPYDEFALEEGLRLKEQLKKGQVIVISIDPEGNEAVMRKALAMGADRGVLVKCDINFDGYPTALILAQVLRGIHFDILFFGKQAIDDDGCQVPSILAHMLNLPRVTVVNKIEYGGDKIRAYRETEIGKEVYELRLPCIVTAQKGLNEPRYPTLKGIMGAKRKPIDSSAYTSPIERKIEVIRMELPPKRPAGRIVGDSVQAVEELVRLLREEAKVL
jgi:electron transfer flavoprotein beta subunit